MDEPDRPSQAQVAIEFGMTENAVKQGFYRFRQRYQTLLREEIAHTVAMAGDVEDELRHLIAVVRALGFRESRQQREGASEIRAFPATTLPWPALTLAKATILQRAAIFRVTSRLILRITWVNTEPKD
jgi:hypothetical protein